VNWGATFEPWRGIRPLVRRPCRCFVCASTMRDAYSSSQSSKNAMKVALVSHHPPLRHPSFYFSANLSAATLPRVFFNMPCLQRRVLNASVHHPRQDYFSQGSGASPTFRSSISISLSEVMPRFNTLQPRAGRLFPSSEGDELG
jgi:hypothetical protein